LVRFRAILLGRTAYPPKPNFKGTGFLSIKGNRKQLKYTLVLNNIPKVTVSHLHLGPGPGTPILVFLLHVKPSISVKRGIVTGVIRQKDLVGPLKGKSISTLIKLIREGKIFCHVHTTFCPYPTCSIVGGEVTSY
jgi:hypothetical protein